MLTGIEPNRAFYIGGYTKYSVSLNTSVYELSDKWELTTTKLQLGITGWDSVVIDSRLNLTKCMTDPQVWPMH